MISGLFFYTKMARPTFSSWWLEILYESDQMNRAEKSYM